MHDTDEHPDTPPRTPMGRVAIVERDPLVRAGLAALFAAWDWQVETLRPDRHGQLHQQRLLAKPDLLVVAARDAPREQAMDAVRQLRAACGQEVPGMILTDAPVRATSHVDNQAVIWLPASVPPPELRRAAEALIAHAALRP